MYWKLFTILLFASTVMAQGSFIVPLDKATYISQELATTNYGTVDVGKAGWEWVNLAYRPMFYPSLLADSMGNHPGVSWDSGFVCFSLYEYGDYLGTEDTIEVSLRKITQAWVEGEATWNVYSSGNNWVSAGGDFSATKEDGNIGLNGVDYGDGDTLYFKVSSSTLSDTLGDGLILVMEAQNNYDVPFKWTTDDYGTAALQPYFIAYWSEMGDSHSNITRLSFSSSATINNIVRFSFTGYIPGKVKRIGKARLGMGVF